MRSVVETLGKIRYVAFLFAMLCKTAAAEQPLDFAKDVAPIVQKHCVRCHSTGNAKGDVSLATFVDLKENEYVVAGDPDGSYLIELVTASNGEPPAMPQESEPLSDAEVATLRRWIAEGAKWPDGIVIREKSKADASWWAYQPLRKPRGASLTIDGFVRTGLAEHDLDLNPQADRRTLIRRATYDLIGLPPTPEEVEAFVNDSDPKAYENLIDRLLDSPHYGERWGRHWLDVARYSDGQGGFLDQRALPHAWRYRDWVIDALNRDMPYNEFLRMQIAGDLVDDREDTDAKSGVVATGFFAVGPTYKADGKDQKAMMQASADTLDDRVDTLTRGVLGLTVSCARCHDHKFDPIPQLDYYSLAGVFNNTRTRDTRIGQRESLERFAAAEKALRAKEAVRKRLDQSVREDNRRP